MKIFKYIKICLCIICMTMIISSCSKSIEVQIQEQLDLGQKYLTEMNYEQAVIAFTKAIELDEKNIAAYEGLGSVYMATEQYDEAAKAFRNVAQLDGQNQAAYRALGEIYIKTDENLEAIQAYEKLLELNGTDRENYKNLISLYDKTGDYNHAAETFERFVAVFGKESLSEAEIEQLTGYYRVLADQAMAAEDYDTTLMYYQKILELEPDYEVENNVRALIMIDERKPELEEMAKAITTETDYDFHDDMIRNPEFIEYAESLEKPYIFETSDGLYIGVYPGGYVYYGGMQDGVRSGYGKWFYSHDNRITVVESPWQNDKPNGQAEIVTYIDESMIEKEANHTYALTIRESVSLVDGVYDGPSTLRWDMDSGTDPQHHWEVEYQDGMMLAKDGDYAAHCENCNIGLRASQKVKMIQGL